MCAAALNLGQFVDAAAVVWAAAVVVWAAVTACLGTALAPVHVAV